MSGVSGSNGAKVNDINVSVFEGEIPLIALELSHQKSTLEQKGQKA